MQDRKMAENMLSDKDLDIIFRAARSHNKWQDKRVSGTMLKALYDLTRWGPTAANSCPMRLVFVTSPEQREKLVACVSSGNAEKVRTAPVTAIIAYDTLFYDLMPQLFPHNPGAREWFTGDPVAAEKSGYQSSTLQGAYLMIAARALGLDCGPMAGFDKAAVDSVFFPDGRFKSNFLCALGYGDPAGLFPRNPRLSFDEACKIV
jgi:3-hydroxypropanoate dehydrogenase